MMTIKNLLMLLTLTIFIAFGALARADVLPSPPDTIGCAGKKAGTACETDRRRSGICQTAKCSRIKYTAQGPGGTVEYDCLKCVEGNSGDSSRNSGNGGSGVTGAGSVARAVGPWFFAGLFSVPLFIKRRRRNRPD